MTFIEYVLQFLGYSFQLEKNPVGHMVTIHDNQLFFGENDDAHSVIIEADDPPDVIWNAMIGIWKSHIEWPTTPGYYQCSNGNSYQTILDPDRLIGLHKAIVLHLCETTAETRFTRL